MALTNRPRPLNTLLASAQRVTRQTLQRGWGRSKAWQEDAWDMFDLVGEHRFLANTLANRMSQARFYVGQVADDPTEAPTVVEDPRLTEILESIGSSSSARAQLIARLALNLFVAGDGWLVGIPRHLIPPALLVGPLSEPSVDPELIPQPEPGTVDITSLDWRMMSISEVTNSAGGEVTLKLGETMLDHIIVNPDDVILIRVWRPHPRHWWEADSPTRSSLPVLRELVGLTMRSSAEIDSRLAGAGLLIVPQSAQRALKISAGLDEVDDDTDYFTEALMEAMLKPIQDRANASAVVPLVVTVPDEAADKFSFMDFAKPLDQYASERVDQSVRRLALGLDAPPELLLGSSGMNHWGCLSQDAEILTERGWLTHDQLTTDDVALTLNHDTGCSEWKAVEGVQRYAVTDLEMLRLNSRGHDSLSTMNHRWAITSDNHGRREFVTSEDLNTGHRIPTAAVCADLPTMGKFSDAFVELVGWFWTEGWLSNDGKAACIAQSESANPGKTERIRAALALEFGEDGWGFESRQTGQWGSDIVRFNLRASVRNALIEVGGKYPTSAFIRSLTASQLEVFIRTSCAGDGWHDARGELDIWQRDPRALDAYELALILSGRSVTWTEHAGGSCVYGSASSAVRPIKSARQASIGGGGTATMEVERYTGTVWCPTTENGTWLARRNGTIFYTGNSWLVLEDTVSTHLEPPLALISDALTTQYLWPVLVDQGMPVAEAKKYVIWYDISDLIVRPTRSADASSLHEAGAISAQALRTATGFDDSDAPEGETPLPVEVQLALDMVKNAPSLMLDPGLPQLVAQVASVLAGEIPELVDLSTSTRSTETAPAQESSQTSQPAGNLPTGPPRLTEIPPLPSPTANAGSTTEQLTLTDKNLLQELRAFAESAIAAGETFPPSGLKAAGMAVKAADTGRVLMLQRSMSPDDPAAGTWEFPGGKIDEGEEPHVAAAREFSEETGIGLMEGTWELVGTWTSSNGVYQGFVIGVPTETTLQINLDPEDRHVLNPDDPDGDMIEVLAWWQPEHLIDNPALRAELAADLDLVLAAIGPTTPAQAIMASAAARGGWDITDAQADEILGRMK